MKLNKKYKDSVFTSLFNDPKKLFELYNAIEGKSYPLDTPITINTLEDVLYLDRINDVSFVIDDKIVVLVENQSTINDNMPLRFLLYIVRVLEKLLDNKAMYRKKLIKIPTPEFIVLYNGIENYPEQKTLKLSDAYILHGNALELTIKVYNINKGYNEDITKKSETLDGYIFFVERIKENQSSKEMTFEEAVKESILYCINNNILKEYLKKHSTEVVNMLTTEFNLDDAIDVAKEEAREDALEEGLEKGLEKGRIEIAKKLLIENLDIAYIANITELSEEKIKELQKSSESNK